MSGYRGDAGRGTAGKIIRLRLEKAMIAGEVGSIGDVNFRGARTGRRGMKRFCAGVALAAAVALGGGLSMMPARAAPPTVTPSPGYDARLQEQRAAQAAASPAIYQPAPVHRRRAKRSHGGAQ
jgi:hypothetical protein